MNIRQITGALGATTLALALAACGEDSESTTATPAPASTSASEQAASEQAASFTVTDPWVKAADSGMTAMFGTLVNDGPEDVVVTSAAGDISPVMELHETIQADDGSMVMQPKEGGFVVPAGGTHVLEPGADHLMVMELSRALEPGEMVRFTLTFADGSTTEVEATVKTFSGAEEKYQGGDMDGEMDGESGSEMGSETDMGTASPSGAR